MIIYRKDNRNCFSVKIFASHFIFPILIFVSWVTFKNPRLANMYGIFICYISFSGPMFCMLAGEGKSVSEQCAIENLPEFLNGK